MRFILFLAALAALIAAAPSDAEACSPPPCWPGFFTPANGATVPANLPAIRWRPMSGFATSTADPSKVVLARAAAPSVPLPLTATRLPDGTYQLVPAQPLVPGMAYVLTDQSTCGGMAGPSSMFQVAATAPLPASLGALAETSNLIGPLEVGTASGSCSAQVTAHQVGIGLQLAADASPWRDVLAYETLVDGQPWGAASSATSEIPPGSSWRGRAIDLLYLVCQTADAYVSRGLAAGPHEVAMRATLPGSGAVVQSSLLSVNMACPVDGPSDGDGSDGAGDGDGDGGGGCNAGGSGSSSWLVLGALAALARLRRRPAHS